MVVRAVDLVVQRTVVAHHVWDAALELEPEALPGAWCVLTNEDFAGFDAVHAEGGSETPGEQEPRCVGWDSDSCTYATQYSR